MPGREEEAKGTQPRALGSAAAGAAGAAAGGAAVAAAQAAAEEGASPSAALDAWNGAAKKGPEGWDEDW